MWPAEMNLKLVTLRNNDHNTAILAWAEKGAPTLKINFYNFSPKLHTVQKTYIHLFLIDICYSFMWEAFCLNAFHDLQVRCSLQVKWLTPAFSPILSNQVQHSFSRNNFKLSVLWGWQPDFNLGIILYCPKMRNCNSFDTTELNVTF